MQRRVRPLDNKGIFDEAQSHSRLWRIPLREMWEYVKSMAEPIINPVLVAVFYGELIGVRSFIGGAIVLASALWYNLFSGDE